MIDYGERVQEVVDILRTEFSVDDPGLVHCLLAAKLDCKLTYPWLVLETNYYSLQTHRAWFSLGDGYGDSRPVLMTEYRIAWPRRTANAAIEDVIEQRDKARLFVDPEWERMLKPHHKVYLWKYLQQNCLHIRGKYPRRDLVEPRAFERLKQSVERVVDTRFRETQPRRPVPPPGLFYWAELLQRVAPNLEDWDTLLRNLYGLAGRLAYLFDRESNKDDWKTIARVMSNTVPHTTSRIIEILQQYGGKYVQTLKYFPQRMVSPELERLYDNHIFRTDKGRWLLNDPGTQGKDVLRLISGDYML